MLYIIACVRSILAYSQQACCGHRKSMKFDDLLSNYVVITVAALEI